MLSPDDRRTYTEALRPPAGFRFRDGVATTYCLGLETLLGIPLHLALFSADAPIEELLSDGVALLEAIRRTAGGLTVYTDASRIAAPDTPRVLYPLLESAVVEVRAPAESGIFHPKLWLLRFEHAETGRTRLRLLVLSRNLTDARCWDLVLSLEGAPGSRPREENRALSRLVQSLPDLAARVPDEGRVRQTRQLADAALHAEWELPEGYETLRFHVMGLDRGAGWIPDPSDRLLVISPFVSEAALRALAESTGRPAALFSRPEELDGIAPALLERFERVLVLDEAAALEDGEEAEPSAEPGLPTHGLHAKAYLAKRGWRTHVVVGSANATSPALVHGTNVELVAELIGLASRVGEPEDFLDAEGFGRLLVDHLPDPDAEPPDPEVEEAQRALEAVRRGLAAEALVLRFAEVEEGWHATLEPPRPLELAGVADARAWLVTRQEGTAVSLEPLRRGEVVGLPPAPIAHLTSFVVVELRAEAADERVRFVLSLDAVDLPTEERDAAILRDVVRNQDGFLRYLLLLLAEMSGGTDVFAPGGASWERANGSRDPGDDLPVFEQLTRAFCREPERLHHVRRLVEEVARGQSEREGEDGEDGEVLPPGFLDLWAVFEAALGEPSGGAR